MLRDQSQIDVAIPYAQFAALQQQLKDSQLENARLKEAMAKIREQPNNQRLIVKQLQEKLKQLSKNFLKNSQKLLQFQDENRKLKEEAQSLKKSIIDLECDLSKQNQLSQLYLGKNKQLHEVIGNYDGSMKSLQSRLTLREQQLNQLSVKNSQKSKIIRQLEQKCTHYQASIEKYSLQERIITQDNERDYEEIRQKAAQTQVQNNLLRKQSQDYAKSVEVMLPIVQMYYNMMERHEVNIISNYAECLQKFKRKLLEASLLDTNINKQLTLKRDAIYNALEREFERVLDN